ncbi:carbohydrate kinase family protein [Winogradskyella flava]|uniref:carbohydrate kinase family protein n=1 Tax=Winogradskyella flava TaxID=1884876 RepID=UPI002490B45A|nr:carbohydrate kinase [Winogradskyella flava]
MKNNRVICFGEVLWDVFPTHKVVGGAPLNVCFHTNNLGLKAQIISAIGNDSLGEELKTFLIQNNIATDFIHTNNVLSTSTVDIKLSENGNASYTIVEDVAWDALFINEDIVHAVTEADVLIFGSLACRSENNFEVLLHLIEKAQKRVFDVNLRAPFYQQHSIEKLLSKADIVKMNDDELDEIVGWYSLNGDLKHKMAFVIDKFNIETLIITAGEEGAYCIHDGTFLHQEGFRVEVKDTVGSGDSFLAALVYKMLNDKSWEECLQFACATGSLLATKSGGTHKVDENRIQEFMQKSN